MAETTSQMRTWTFAERHPTKDGPWANEPDKAQWIDEATGLDCLIVRNHGGALCGYVGVPPEHPLHGKDYDEAYDFADIDVHGGLTYAAACQEVTGETGICHVPEPGRPADVWWFGFDCAHLGDLSPSYERPYITTTYLRDVYRDFTYVQGEITSLARQLAAVTP